MVEEFHGKCSVCEKVSKSRCSGCVQVFYCSVDHQKKDWKNHKSTCSPMKVCHNEKFGRHYVATRNIKPGEIVLREAPLVIGPSQSTVPVCVGCLQKLHENAHMECETCGWPVCSRNCQNNINHQAECKLTIDRGSKVSIKNFGSPHPTYTCLLPLRCLLLKENDTDKWNKLLELQSHHDAANVNPISFKPNAEGVAKFIPRFLKCNKWSEDEITKINGIAQINGHEIPLTVPSCVAIYHQASFFEHNCRPNLSKSFTDRNEIIFWAPNSIKANEHLTISYTDVLWETSNRRHHLQQTKLFVCDCERCCDVTEYGTYFSSLKCLKCPEGMLTPKSLAEWNNDWKCTKCSYIVSYEHVNKLLEHAGRDLAAMEKESEENCIKFIDHYSKWLSSNHFYITDVKVALAQIIGGGVMNGIQRVSDDRLQLKAKTCRELIDLIHKVSPNEARILGLIKFELHSAYAEIGRRALQVKDPNCKSLLEESLEYCKETMRLLANEPECLPEGSICKQAKINSSSLVTLIGGMFDSGML